MTRVRIAYMPLATYPEVVGDSSIHAATAFAASLECEMSVTTFSVDIPQISSPLGNLLLDVPGLIKAAEDKSRAESHRLHDLVLEAAGAHFTLHCTRNYISDAYGKCITFGFALSVMRNRIV